MKPLSVFLIGMWIGLFVAAMLMKTSTNTPPVASQTHYNDNPNYWNGNHMPGLIEVRGEKWRVVTEDPADMPGGAYLGLYGYTDCDQKAIFILQDIPEGTKREALIHELFHAGSCKEKEQNFYWNSKSQLGHEGIHRIGSFLADLLHENPELTEYLAGGK